MRLLLFACCLIFILVFLGVFARAWVEQLLHPRNFPKGSAVQQFAESLRLRLDPLASPASYVSSEPVLPPHDYRLHSRLGSGDLCDVYRASRAGRDYAIKIPRDCHSHPWLLLEQARLRSLVESPTAWRYRDYLTTPCGMARIGQKHGAVFELRRGYRTASSIRRCFPGGLDGRHVAWMFNRTLEILGFIHQQGWVHGAVLPPHLLFHPENHGLQLIGWTHSQPIGQPLRFAPRQYRSWYPPECRRRQAATAAVDIYLAAQSMIWLAGGDPQTGFLPDHLPIEFQRLLLHCRDDAVANRPRNAWKLHAEFRELLEGVYGPPRFVHLHLS